MVGSFRLKAGEGSGKTTQAAVLYRRLNAAGIKTILTREPGGSPRAEQIRTVLLSGAAEGLGPDGEALLFAAARADHLDQVIKPALQSGEWVVCDRFVDFDQGLPGRRGWRRPGLHQGT